MCTESLILAPVHQVINLHILNVHNPHAADIKCIPRVVYSICTIHRIYLSRQSSMLFTRRMLHAGVPARVPFLLEYRTTTSGCVTWREDVIPMLANLLMFHLSRFVVQILYMDSCTSCWPFYSPGRRCRRTNHSPRTTRTTVGCAMTGVHLIFAEAPHLRSCIYYLIQHPNPD